LNREYAVQKEQYDKLMSERERVRLRGDISSETDAVQFRVIDPPSSPLAPSAPNRPLLIFGGLPVLGSISQMLTPKEASERKRWLKYYYGAAASLVGVFALLMGIELAQRSAFL
jgi:polysaccharide biosynthesis transport protein